MTDREKKEHQEAMLFENQLALEVLNAQKSEEYKRYLRLNSQRYKSGMSAEEIEAVQLRAVEAAKEI